MPCNDIEVKEDSSGVATVTVDTSAHDHSVVGDLCSPFCQCHCCHVHTIDLGIASFKPLQPVIFKENFAHIDSHSKDFNPTFLQPPRV